MSVTAPITRTLTAIALLTMAMPAETQASEVKDDFVPDISDTEEVELDLELLSELEVSVYPQSSSLTYVSIEAYTKDAATSVLDGESSGCVTWSVDEDGLGSASLDVGEVCKVKDQDPSNDWRETLELVESGEIWIGMGTWDADAYGDGLPDGTTYLQIGNWDTDNFTMDCVFELAAIFVAGAGASATSGPAAPAVAVTTGTLMILKVWEMGFDDEFLETSNNDRECSNSEFDEPGSESCEEQCDGGGYNAVYDTVGYDACMEACEGSADGDPQTMAGF